MDRIRAIRIRIRIDFNTGGEQTAGQADESICDLSSNIGSSKIYPRCQDGDGVKEEFERFLVVTARS